MAEAADNLKRKIRVSEITAYKVCPRMYYYRYVCGLVPKSESPKLFLGKGVHAGIAAYYCSGNSRRAALEAFDSWVEDESANLLNGDALMKDVELGRGLVGAYCDYASAHDNFVPMRHEGEFCIEQPFSVPVWDEGGNPLDGVHYTGTFDGIAVDAHGNYWLLEHKTASSFPSDITLRLDEQAGFYLLAASMLLPEPPVGVIYNVMRKVMPEKARQAVVKRYHVVRTPYELEQLRKRLYYAYVTITSDKLFMPSPGLHCGWRCAYSQLCVCEHEGVDPQPLVDEFYRREGDAQVEDDQEDVA